MMTWPLLLQLLALAALPLVARLLSRGGTAVDPEPRWRWDLPVALGLGAGVARGGRRLLVGVRRPRPRRRRPGPRLRGLLPHRGRAT